MIKRGDYELKIDPEVIALGQSLAEYIRKAPPGVYRLEIRADGMIDVRMTIENNGYEVELMLTPSGEWELISMPYYSVPYPRG